MISLSKKVVKSMCNSLNETEILENYYENYLLGDRAALMDALIICSVFQKTIPDWVADELLDLDEKLDNGSLSDLNEFFGFRKIVNTKVKFNKKVENANDEIYKALFFHRMSGKNFTAADGLEEVHEKTGFSRRVVEAVYKRNKEKLNKLQKKPDSGSNHIFGIGMGKINILQEIAKLKRKERDK